MKLKTLLCAGGPAFCCNCPITSNRLRLWAHERTPAVPRNVGDLQSVAEDLHWTRCAHVCFGRTEEAHSEPHDQGTIDNSVEGQDSDDLWDTTRAVDAEAEHLVLIPHAGHPVIERERLTSWVCLLHRASDVSVATTRIEGLKRTKCHHVRPLLFQPRRRHRLV